MAKITRINKRDREVFILESCLSREWGGKAWEIVDERERPDFVVRDPAGDLVGVEVTELLATDQGEERSLEGRLNTVTIEVIAANLQEANLLGAVVFGYNSSAPGREMDLTRFREDFQNHLAAHLDCKSRTMRVPFRHPWGEVEAISPGHGPGIDLVGSGSRPHPKYMNARAQQEIEADLLVCVRRKVMQARGYDHDWPLWLVVRNPSEGIDDVLPEARYRVRALAGGVFQRVILANLPLGREDPRPPYPFSIDIL